MEHKNTILKPYFSNFDGRPPYSAVDQIGRSDYDTPMKDVASVSRFLIGIHARNTQNFDVEREANKMEAQEEGLTVLQVLREEITAMVMVCVDMELLDLLYKLLLDNNI